MFSVFRGTVKENKRPSCDETRRLFKGSVRVTHYYTNNVYSRSWMTGNSYHRATGPAQIMYCLDKPVEMNWWEHGLRHRLSGPACIFYLSNGDTIEEWYNKGKCGKSKNLPFLAYFDCT